MKQNSTKPYVRNTTTASSEGTYVPVPTYLYFCKSMKQNSTELYARSTVITSSVGIDFCKSMTQNSTEPYEPMKHYNSQFCR
jgi:hypothetical protein